MRVRLPPWLAAQARRVAEKAPDAPVASGRIMRVPLELTITHAGGLERSSTTITGTGRVVVVIATALPARGLTVTSSYIGAAHGPTAAVCLLEAPQRTTTLTTDSLDGRELPVAHARDRLLLHHAGALLDLLADQLGEPVTVDVPPDSLAIARLAYPVACSAPRASSGSPR